INPWRVAIELVESRVGEPRLLADFSRRHRERGYLIVIDDFGLAHSNFERLIDVRPDIIKIDRGIIDGVEADHYRRSIVRSIVELARDTGALSLAEGVENEAQITTCALLGAELFQGYALAAPCPEPSVVSAEVARRIDAGIQAVQQEAARKLDEKRRTVARYKEVATRVTAEVRTALLRCGVPGAENALDALVDGFHGIGCAYLLDSRGIQVTTTHVSTAAARRPRHVLFQPASPGADHSLKGYFHDMRGRSEYFTDPYISLATGNMCTTLATRITAGPDTEYILCVDFE
ncbi:MAG TPA: EAL domain-containing protein, partial [Spirochaetia bacterium]